MQIVKRTIKKALKVDYTSNVDPLNDLIPIGSHLHSYYVPEKYLDKNSICYLVGAGEDISFDTELVVRFGSKVFIFDPAPEGINHFKKLKEATAKNEKIFVDGPTPFYYRINSEQLNSITYIETGLWDKETLIKFYKPTIENYVSHSIELFKHSNNFIEVPVDRLGNLMKKFNHSYIDLLKLEIEGAEYTVLKTIVEDKLDVRMILVEFDETYHAKDFGYLFRIKKATENLIKAGYKLAHSTFNHKKLFIRNDVFQKLKEKGYK